ncbi:MULTISPECIES: hypothetical protein [unclassified Methylobacterium]|jgi:hypothetical protein|uniref:hypothetical protein n=1 Tax=unclassified Methylobacterium TaxID=2615210 RepID=UPI0005BD95B0|nr:MULTISPECIES: hypothetical protein [unclassified Methylobacterium]SFU74683.1 hypothetical protein SAMN02799643_02126 [Methylobacterium sp. UNCCL125]
MARRPVLDDRRIPIGYLEDVDGLGRIRVLDAKLRVVGYVDTRRDETLDAQYRVIAKGSVPGLLLR